MSFAVVEYHPQGGSRVRTVCHAFCCVQAVTLPASWYTQPAALQLEKQHVLYNTWQVGCCRFDGACTMPCHQTSSSLLEGTCLPPSIGALRCFLREWLLKLN